MPIIHQKHGIPFAYGVIELTQAAQDMMAARQCALHIAIDDMAAHKMQELAAFFMPEAEIIYLPAWDCLPYDRVSPNPQILAARAYALCQLLAWRDDKTPKPRILITTINATLQKMLPPQFLQNARLHVQKGRALNEAQLQGFLSANGYSRTDTVREAGDYAIRGGIIDLYPADAPYPIRLDLFGEEVEQIKQFDPETQRSIDTINEFSLYPVTELFLNEDTKARFISQYRQLFGMPSRDDPLFEAIQAGRVYNGMEHWLPLFYESMSDLSDYADIGSITMDYHVQDAAAERIKQIQDFYDTRQSFLKGAPTHGSPYKPIAPTLLYQMDLLQSLCCDATEFIPFQREHETPPAKRSRDFGDIRALPDGDVIGHLRQYAQEYSMQGIKTMIACMSEGSRNRIDKILRNANFAGLKKLDHIRQVKKLVKGEVGLIILPVDQGFISKEYALISESDIFGDRLSQSKPKRKSKADQFLREVSALEVGDLVVHIDHGVGRFMGLVTIQAGGAAHDCLQLSYHNDDKLFVPVENMDVLSRFGADSGTVTLDRLGGVAWQAKKAQVKKDLMRMAGQLLDIAAARKMNRAPALSTPSGIYDEFVARFPYQETEDQLRAIHDVLTDMDSGSAMDRLICGDVGFGKTEVALRAAYVAAMSGVQVAMVAPTTLLCRQHYQNFINRFQGLGIRIQQLSRLVTATDSKKIKDELSNGTVDIVIGTHALFSSSTNFKNLGLLIVDEEQKFGVKQKEKLKEIKKNIHVLTLSATPIPRTLQMSLTGVRDLSLITTPPVDRLAIRTFIAPFDPMIVREALLREHYRGGQSFYVCPRISDIVELEKSLKELVPELKIIAAHGQMTPTDLEDRMNDFYDRHYDVLLATNIIESGIDIPSANTMIIHRADMFGLGQLYQIRGRIGRSKQRAYAYLTYDPKKPLAKNAEKRLEVMETLDNLGSGFQLASYDMDIRGAGNILGEEQSGHIKEVGVELYQQMLEEAVATVRASGSLDNAIFQDRFSPQISVGAAIMIPEAYIPDLNIRMSLYRRLSDLEHGEDLDAIAAEMVDRFGTLPQEVENLLEIMTLKKLCHRARIDRLDAGSKGMVISFHQNKPNNPEKLMHWIHERRGFVKIRPDQKLLISKNWETIPARIDGVKGFIEGLVGVLG